MNTDEIKIGDVEYIRKDKVLSMAQPLDGLPYMMVRTQSAGVFAGYLKERNGLEATLLQARRIWYWTGAASLSQLAMEGTSSPSTCKFPCEVLEVILTQVIEVIPITAKAQASIKSVSIWKQ